MSYAPGQVIGSFRLVSLLGRGGVAEVWKAQHATLTSFHAIKFLAVHTGSLHARLMLEGRVQAMLTHPNVVRVTDLVDDAPRIGLVLEYVDGPSLDRWIAGSWRAEEVERIFLGICAGVRSAHARGLVHRDLKPANVLLATVDGVLVPRVSDFGIARALQSGQGTRTGALLGTLRYMAPEQLRDASRVDARADIWALGCILYELLSRRSLLPDADLVTLYERLKAGKWPALSEVAADAPPALVRIAESALCFEVEGRPATVDELLAPLQGALEALDAGAVAPTNPGVHRVGAYRLEVRVGGTDDVQAWRATDAGGGPSFLKLVPANGSADSIARVEREARLGRALSHPGLLPTRAVIAERLHENPVLVYVRDWLPVPTLEEQARDRRYSSTEVMERVASVLDVLAALHGNVPPVVHADLHPAHVLVADSGIRLIGLGRAQQGAGAELGGSTFVGSFGWQAPEQLAGDALPASDVYVAGVLAVWMLSRCDVGALHDSRGRFLYEPVIDAPRALRSVLASMLAAIPEDRPTAADAAAALRAAARGAVETAAAPLAPAFSGRVSPRGPTIVADDGPQPPPPSPPGTTQARDPLRIPEPLVAPPRAPPGMLARIGTPGTVASGALLLALSAAGGSVARELTRAPDPVPAAGRPFINNLLPPEACFREEPQCSLPATPVPPAGTTVDFEGDSARWGGRGFQVSDGLQPAPGPFGRALQFAGPHEGAYANGTSRPPAFTVALWARIEPPIEFDEVVLYTDGMGLGAYTGVALAVNWLGQVTFRTADGSQAGEIRVTSPRRICGSRWTQIAASSGPSGTSLYVDGVRVADAPASASPPLRGDRPVVLGFDGYYPERRLTGALDEVRAWDEVLDDAAIAETYRADRCRADKL